MSKKFNQGKELRDFSLLDVCRFAIWWLIQDGQSIEIAGNSNQRSSRNILGIGCFRSDLRVVEGKCFLGCSGGVESDDSPLGCRIRRRPDVPNLPYNLIISSLGLYPVCEEGFDITLRNEAR